MHSLAPRSVTVVSARPLLFMLTLICVLVPLLHTQQRPLPARLPASPAPAAVAEQVSRMALAFVPNTGQSDPDVRFQARTPQGTLFFTASEVVLALPSVAPGAAERPPRARMPDAPPPAPAAPDAVVRVQFVGAQADPAMTGINQQPGVVNLYLGNDPSRWRTNLPTYAGVVYRNLYPGIDLRYDGQAGRVKGTYDIAPHADPGQIRWRYAGATAVQIEAATGDLLITLPPMPDGTPRTLREHAPVAWQTRDGQRVAVPARFVADNGSVSFALDAYTASQPLTIDPTLVYSTFLGGSVDDDGSGITVDASGSVVVTGSTTSANFPTRNPLQPASGGSRDTFVTALDAGGVLRFSTFLGGSADDNGSGITVDASGNVVVTGSTTSANFPTYNALQPTFGGGDYDAFIIALDPNGTLRFSTFLGGTSTDIGSGIIVDGSGSVVVTGSTTSANFPTYNALQPTSGGSRDTFVTALNPNGTLRFSTFLGGTSDDYGWGIAVDDSGNMVVTGSTFSANFPTLSALQPTFGGSADAFVTALEPNGALRFSTFLGGTSDDAGLGIAVDGSGNVVVTGQTNSANFPTHNPLQPTIGGGNDAFVTKLSLASRLMLTASASSATLPYCPQAPCAVTTFNVTVSATDGPVQATLAATIPQELDVVIGTVTGGATYDPVTRQVRFSGPVAPGAPVTLAYQATLRPATSAGAPLVTNVTASGSSSYGAVPVVQQSVALAVADDGFTGTQVLLYASGDNDLTERMATLFDRAAQGATDPSVVTWLLLDGPQDDDTMLYRLHAPAPSQSVCLPFSDPSCGGRYLEGRDRWRWPSDDLGNPQTLTAFLTTASAAYPSANHRILSLIGHGGGWSPSVLEGQPSGGRAQPGGDPLGGMLWDQHSGTTLSTPELGQALRAATTQIGQSFDLLFLDACDMSMLEVAYEVRDSARYLLASPNWKWAEFPYDQHLRSAAAGDGLAVGRAWLQEEVQAVGSIGEPYTYALLDESKMDSVRQATDALATALMRADGPLATADSLQQLLNAVAPADRYDSTQDGAITVGDSEATADNYTDLLSVARQLAAAYPDGDPVARAASQVVTAAGEAVVLQVVQGGLSRTFNQRWAWQSPGGLSIYLPLHYDDWRRRYYGLLAFTQDGQWDEFLNARWQNAPPPPDPTCSPQCGLPPGPLAPMYRLYMPLALQ